MDYMSESIIKGRQTVFDYLLTDLKAVAFCFFANKVPIARGMPFCPDPIGERISMGNFCWHLKQTTLYICHPHTPDIYILSDEENIFVVFAVRFNYLRTGNQQRTRASCGILYTVISL